METTDEQTVSDTRVCKNGIMNATDPAGSPGGVRSLQAEVDRLKDENVELFAAGVTAYDRERRQLSEADDDDPAAIARLRRMRTIATVVHEALTPRSHPADDNRT